MATAASRLILGGHSFLEALGNDPAASFEEQCAIVAACLDSGIRRIDTTYYQERVALGRVLQTLGRRDEAAVLAWNFFRQPGRENDLVPWTPYAPHHLQIMLDELQTERIDLLVIHAHDDADGLRAEMERAAEWKAAGRVREVGLGMAQTKHLHDLPGDHPITHVLAPFNAFNRSAAALFVAVRARGCIRLRCRRLCGAGNWTRSMKTAPGWPTSFCAGWPCSRRWDSIDVAVRKRRVGCRESAFLVARAAEFVGAGTGGHMAERETGMRAATLSLRDG